MSGYIREAQVLNLFECARNLIHECGKVLSITAPETDKQLPDGEIGEVQLRGLNVFKGYWHQPQKTAKVFTLNGWFRTGDPGFRETDRYYTLCGRSKDLILNGGLNIYPPEVERVLNENPAVESSAVIGCPDPEWGERVVAVVVLKHNQSVSNEDLIGITDSTWHPINHPR